MNYLVSKLFSFAEVCEIDFSKFDCVIRFGKDHGQGKHAKDEADGQADAVVIHQVVKGVVKLCAAGFVDHTVQGFVVAAQNKILKNESAIRK
jgi:hypothetical protein